MDRKLFIKRVEVVLAVVLVVVIVLGIGLLLFKSIPPSTENVPNNGSELLPGFPSDPNQIIKFLDLTGKKEFTALGKKITLPGEAVVSSAYNRTQLSEFTCKNDTSEDCTIYEVNIGGRKFYISAPIVIKLKQPTSDGTVSKDLSVAGESVKFTYTQRKFYNPKFNDKGEITETIQDSSLTNIEEIYGCLSNNICFSSGRLTNEKVPNDLDVAAFESFVQSVVVM